MPLDSARTPLPQQQNRTQQGIFQHFMGSRIKTRGGSVASHNIHFSPTFHYHCPPDHSRQISGMTTQNTNDNDKPSTSESEESFKTVPEFPQPPSTGISGRGELSFKSQPVRHAQDEMPPVKGSSKVLKAKAKKLFRWLQGSGRKPE